jgi:hypothetical protein
MFSNPHNTFSNPANAPRSVCPHIRKRKGETGARDSEHHGIRRSGDSRAKFRIRPDEIAVPEVDRRDVKPTKKSIIGNTLLGISGGTFLAGAYRMNAPFPFPQSSGQGVDG